MKVEKKTKKPKKPKEKVVITMTPEEASVLGGIVMYKITWSEFERDNPDLPKVPRDLHFALSSAGVHETYTY